jgi:hypothetical protein
VRQKAPLNLFRASIHFVDYWFSGNPASLACSITRLT